MTTVLFLMFLGAMIFIAFSIPRNFKFKKQKLKQKEHSTEWNLKK